MPTCAVEGCDEDAIATMIGADGVENAWRCRGHLLGEIGV